MASTKTYVSKPALLGLVAVSAVLPLAMNAYKNKMFNNKAMWITMAVSALVSVGIVAVVTIPFQKKITV